MLYLLSIDTVNMTCKQTTFVQIVCGIHFACGVTLDQRVLCWGQGVPSEIKGLYSQISAGTNFACGVMTDGHVNCWGTSCL